ncbi:hypothetical protein B7Z00_02925 [Candidatus Saccharibacteria bacterium 32-50-10]|nr:MAG: hypothetical protein B7Z00_02925 [Candidatus Saccharibacteria bacterium 32-50-10]
MRKRAGGFLVFFRWLVGQAPGRLGPCRALRGAVGRVQGLVGFLGDGAERGRDVAEYRFECDVRHFAGFGVVGVDVDHAELCPVEVALEAVREGAVELVCFACQGEQGADAFLHDVAVDGGVVDQSLRVSDVGE